MKMLYQNAVYKSLNLNLSPSNSSARSRTGSREASLKNRAVNPQANGSGKKVPTSTKALENSNSDFKFHVNNEESSTERIFKIKKANSNLRRQKSQNSKQVNITQEQSNLILKQYGSPSEARKLLKMNSNTEIIVGKEKLTHGFGNKKNEEDLTDRLRQKENTVDHKNLYMNYRRTSKSGLRTLTSNSQAKLTNKVGYQGDDTFDAKQAKTKVNQPDKAAGLNVRRLPINYKTKNLASLNHSQSREIDASCTLDSARNSQASQKSLQSQVKEFLEAASNGNRDKLSSLLQSKMVSDVNVTDSHNRSALHYAVSEGRYKTV